MKKILLIAFINAVFVSIYSQNIVNYNGVQINLDEIPMNGPLRLEGKKIIRPKSAPAREKTSVINITEQKAYASPQKDILLLNTRYHTLTDAEIQQFQYEHVDEHTIFEVVDNKGNLLWSKEHDKDIVYSAKVSPDNSKIIAYWICNRDECPENDIVIYDIEGNEINRIKKVHSFSKGYNNEQSFFCFHFNDYEDDMNKEYIIYNYNYDENKVYSTKLEQKFHLLDISSNNNFLAIYINNKIRVYNSTCKLEFTVNVDKRPRKAIISNCGKHILVEPTAKSFYISDRNSNIIIKSTDILFGDWKPYAYADVDNTDNLFFTRCIHPNRYTGGIIFDLNGKILAKEELPKRKLGYKFFVTKNNDEILFYTDGLFVKSFKISNK